MITYPVDTTATAGRWRILDTNTGNITKLGGNGNWPTGDGSEIQGLEPHLVPLLVENTPAPGVDDRLNRIEGTPVVDQENNRITTSWAIISREAQEKRDAALNIEQQEFAKHLDPSRLSVQNTLVITAILRHIKGQNIPAGLMSWIDDFQARGEKIYKNRQKVQVWLDQIEAGENPDFDAVTFEDPSE